MISRSCSRASSAGFFPLHNDHLNAAVRYVALNTVRAHLSHERGDWRRSNVCAHLEGRGEGLMRVRPALDRVGRLLDLMDTEADDLQFASLRRSEGIGRPLESEAFVQRTEAPLRRNLPPG